MSDLWDGVEKPDVVEKARLFFNGFLESPRCECGGEKSEAVRRTTAGLARVEECEDCDRTTFVEMYEPRVNEV